MHRDATKRREEIVERSVVCEALNECTQVAQCLVEVLLFGGVRHEGLECGSAIEVGCTV